MTQNNTYQYREKVRTLKSIRGWKCEACPEDHRKLHAHHIVPVDRGGTDEDENLLILCVKCHKRIHNKVMVSEEEGGFYPRDREEALFALEQLKGMPIGQCLVHQPLEITDMASLRLEARGGPNWWVKACQFLNAAILKGELDA